MMINDQKKDNQTNVISISEDVGGGDSYCS